MTVESFLNAEHGDSRRLTVAILAALAIHLCLFAVLGIIRLAERPLETGPVSVDLLAGSLAGLPAGAPGPAASGAASAGPVVPAAPAPSRAAGASRGGLAPGSDFVIPTPRQGAGAPTQPTGPSFRTSGGRAGAQAGASQPGAPLAASPVQTPVFPSARTAGTEGTAPAAGQAAPGNLGGGSSRGVLVQGGGQQGVQGSLEQDLGSLDKSLKGARGQGGAASGGGEAAAGGTGGAAAAGGATGGGGGGGGDYRFRWDQPEAAKARRLLSTVSPRIPPWVSKEGLTLNFLIDFTLTPEGILRDVTIEASSGYPEVDAAVSEAIRHWRFNADPGSRAIHGQIPYAIQAR